MNIKNLELLREALTKLSNKHFHLRDFVDFDYDSQPSSVEELIFELTDEENSCGTTACVVGNFPIMFPDIFEFDMGFNVIYKDQAENKRVDSIDVVGGCISFRISRDWLGFKHVNYRWTSNCPMWNYLFSPGHYADSELKDKKFVIERIDLLLSGKAPDWVYEEFKE